MAGVKFGISVLLEQQPHWRNQKIALVTNSAAKTETGQSSAYALLKAGFNVVKLFSPEHGFDIKGADGAKIADGFDAETKLPIVSLYGEKLEPNAADLQDIDFVLFDIPDIGARFYTYLWTLTYVLEACQKHQKQLVVLDRPNPIGLNLALSEGPFLDEENCSSFIGRWNIPLRHSCTLGELALYFNTSKNIHANLTVIPCKQLSRAHFFPNWGIAFTPTSPAIDSFNAAILYPGLGLLEATNLTEGRGTSASFQLVAAPWLKQLTTVDAELANVLDLVPFSAMPTEAKYKGEMCNGYLLSPKDYRSFKAVETGLVLIKLIKDAFPLHFAWQPYITNVNPTGTKHLDKLLGIMNSEVLFDLPFPTFKNTVKNICQLADWPQQIQPYLLY